MNQSVKLYRVQQGMNYGKCFAYDPELRKLKSWAGRTLDIYRISMKWQNLRKWILLLFTPDININLINMCSGDTLEGVQDFRLGGQILVLPLSKKAVEITSPLQFQVSYLKWVGQMHKGLSNNKIIRFHCNKTENINFPTARLV